MKVFSIYLTGVGGQGIGLIGEIILRASDHSGHTVKSVDTHGLAQRGGIVVTQIRIGDDVFSPLIPAGQADLVVSLERHEALRAAGTALKDNGCLIYYNTVWQPLSVRLNETAEVVESDILDFCRARGIQVMPVFHAGLKDVRMQNMAVLSEIHRHQLIPGINLEHIQAAMADLMSGTMLEENRRLFDKRLTA
jgi:indolepyruvate ferredoxin oxidoreductase, beta subunit